MLVCLVGGRVRVEGGPSGEGGTPRAGGTVTPGPWAPAARGPGAHAWRRRRVEARRARRELNTRLHSRDRKSFHCMICFKISKSNYPRTKTTSRLKRQFGLLLLHNRQT